MSQPHSVLHVVSTLRWCGAAEQCLALAEAQNEAGDAVVVACQPGSPLQRRARAAGIQILPVLMRGAGDVSAVRTLRSFVTRHGITLVHSHDRRARALVAVTTLGGLARRVATRRKPGAPRRGLTGLGRRLGVDHWVAISPAVAESLYQSGLARDDVSVIPPGVPLEGGPPRDDESRARVLPRFGLAGHTGPLVGSVHQLDEREGMEQLVEAAGLLAPHCPGLKIVVAGEGDQRQFVNALVNRRRLEDVVLLPGWTDHAADLLAALDVYVAPGADHVSLARALAAGCPVVAVDDGDNRDLVDHEQSGLLVPARDGQALSDALGRLLGHREYAEGLGASARRVSRERASLGAMVHAHQRLYDRLLARQGSSAI